MNRNSVVLSAFRSGFSYTRCISFRCLSNVPSVQVRVPCRFTGTYPTPSTAVPRKRQTKMFNYLTHKRLVSATPDAGEGDGSAKASSDSNPAVEPVDDLQLSVATHIHYFPEHVTNFVFFSSNRGPKKPLPGKRDFSPRLTMRLQLLVLHRLLKNNQREKLVELMEKAHLRVPDAATWKAFSDKRTNDVTCGIVYSNYVLHQLRALFIAENSGFKHVSPAACYVGLYIRDTKRVPSLESWFAKLGPVQPQELRANMKVDNRPLVNWGRAEVEAAIEKMDESQQDLLVKHFKKNAKAIMSYVALHHVFVQTVLIALNGLPEMRALHGPMKAFKMEFTGLWYLQQGGAYYPNPCGANSAWVHLPQEEKKKYLPFGSKDSGPRSATRSFFKYCQRDYGMDRSQARERLLGLTELQLDAMKFPFDVSLSSNQAGVPRSFRLFVKDMMVQYGLARQQNRLYRSNRLFTAVMRAKWLRMSAEERMAYEEEDVAGVFPLQCTKHRDASDAPRVLWSSQRRDSENDEDSLQYLERFGSVQPLAVDAQAPVSAPPPFRTEYQESSGVQDLTVDISALELPGGD